MKRINLPLLTHGMIGGLLAAGVIALWFLLVDIVTAQEFRTPTVLAQAILGETAGVSPGRLVVAYTFLHFSTFALLGAAAALLLRALKTPPGLLVGGIFGIGLFSTVYYATLLITGANLGTLVGTHVIIANLLGGMVLMAYLHYATHAENPLGLGYLWQHPLFAQGMVTGLVGAGTVALWFLLVDVLRGAPFLTPAALGSLVFLGATSPTQIQFTVGVVGAYTLVHLAGFAVVGVVFVWAARELENLPAFWLMAFMAFVILDGVAFLVLGGVGEWMLGTLSWWVLGIANLLAVAAMAGWIWATRSELRHQLRPVRVPTMQ